MPYLDVLWNDEPGGNADKIAQHGLTKDDVIDVFDDPRVKTRSRSSGLPLWKGYTRDGRLVTVVFEWIDQVSVMPITAFSGDEE